MSNQELLREKAELVCERCTSADLPQPLFRIASDFAVNFTWMLEGSTHTLSLYHNQKHQSWKSISNTDWLRNVVEPVIQPLFEQQQSRMIPTQTQAIAKPDRTERTSRLQAYFADAFTCLSLLEPFANDNIDFSIICHRTREAVKMVLTDPIRSQLDHQALSEALEMPDTTHFSEAKEYLIRCLTLCHINNAVN